MSERVINTNLIPMPLRGVILGSVNKAVKERIGGKMTNAEYAEERGISERQASKKRRGY